MSAPIAAGVEVLYHPLASVAAPLDACEVDERSVSAHYVAFPVHEEL